MSVETHVRAIHAAIRADHEERVAEIRAWADGAAARGDINAQRRHLAHVDRLEALPKPWEGQESDR